MSENNSKCVRPSCSGELVYSPQESGWTKTFYRCSQCGGLVISETIFGGLASIAPIAMLLSLTPHLLESAYEGIVTVAHSVIDHIDIS